MNSKLPRLCAFLLLISGTASADDRYYIREARNLPDGFPKCKVYAHKDGPNKDRSVAAAGSRASYSVKLSDCPDNGWFVQGPPPAR